MMSDQELQDALKRLAKQNPKMHSYTLSLLLQVETGRIVSGAAVSRMLQNDK